MNPHDGRSAMTGGSTNGPRTSGADAIPNAIPKAGQPADPALLLRLPTVEAAERVLGAIRALTIVVVGDVCLDEYLIGRAERVSREAPVPVLSLRVRRCLPGGAANPSVNAAALGARVRQVGIVGADAAADELRASLTAAGIDAAGLVVDAGRPTTTKTRVVAEGLSAPQQVARIDRQDRSAVDGAVGDALAAALASAAVGADAILVSHYRSGVVTAALCEAARAAARANGALLTVDGQGDLDWFHGFDVVRVGRADAAASLGRALDDEADFEAASRTLRAKLGARIVVLGRGAQGTSVADADGYRVVPPTNVSEVFDVTGAGDTVIAMLTLALAAGAEPLLAVQLANVAAGWTVRRLGNAAPRPDEIVAELSRTMAEGRMP
ncbi:MAG: PfkB family carbohydrate kinase [Ardenticatenales bacterium]